MTSTLARPLGLAALLGLNIALAAGLAAGATKPAVAAALLPACVIGAFALVVRDRSILVLGALAFDLSGVLALRRPMIGTSVFASDILLAVAVGSFVAAFLAAPPGRRPQLPRTLLLRWPLLILALAVGQGVVRGHFDYGLSYFSQPTRFVFYAAIAVTLVDVSAERLWRGVVAVFYVGAVWNALAAAYYLATGTVQQIQSSDLSTGGTRILTVTSALSLTGALLLALLSFEHAEQTPRKLGHLVIASLAVSGIAVSYGRGVFLALGMAVLLLLLLRPRLRGSFASLLPLWILPIALAAVLITHEAPRFFPDLFNRIVALHTSDPSIHWRQAANAAIWMQVHAHPLVGVGFGKSARFTVDFTSFTITQDPHDTYLFLLAGGGLLTLGTFLALYGIFLWDARRNYGFASEHGRLLIVWAAGFWLCFALNALVEPELTQPNSLLSLWLLMLIPAAVGGAGGTQLL